MHLHSKEVAKQGGCEDCSKPSADVCVPDLWPKASCSSVSLSQSHAQMLLLTANNHKCTHRHLRFVASNAVLHMVYYPQWLAAMLCLLPGKKCFGGPAEIVAAV